MKHKKTLAAMLCLALLTGCGDPADAGPPSPPPTHPQPEKTEQPDRRCAVEELYHEDGSFTDQDGQTVEYTYHVPKIQADAPGAQEINQKLEATFGPVIQKALAEMEAGKMPLCCRVTWEKHWSEEVLSLLVTEETQTDQTISKAFCYDCAADAVLTSQALLKRSDVSETAFFDALRREAVHALERGGGKLYPELVAQTVWEHNLNWDRVQLFLEEDGTLSAVTPLATPAGGGVYCMTLKPDLTKKSGVTKTVTCGPVTAELKDNAVSLTFQKDPESIPTGFCPEYQKPYQVEGLYGVYTDLAVGVMGNSFMPFLFLTDTEGRVTVCNIMQCALCCDRFFATGPLENPRGVTGYEAVLEEDGQSVYACTDTGEKVDLWEDICAEPLLRLLNPSIWTIPETAYTLQYNDDHFEPLTWGGGGGLLASGWLYQGGITEQGVQYLFQMWTEEGDSVCGMLTLTQPIPDSQEPETLTLTQFSGPRLSGVPKTGMAEMTCTKR